MTDEHAKFVEEMLKKAKEKQETKPQKRFESVNTEEVEKVLEEIKKGKKSK